MKVKNIILLFPLFILLIYWILHFASSYFIFLTERNVEHEEAKMFLNACLSPSLMNSAHCKRMEVQAKSWPFLVAAKDVVVNSPKIFEQAISPIMGVGRFYSPLLYVIIAIVFIAIIIICIAPELVGYIFWKSFSYRNRNSSRNKVMKKEYGLIEG